MFTGWEKGSAKFGRPRCITAPASEVKVAIGPFIYSLEKVWSNYDLSYCGNKNWTEMS